MLQFAMNTVPISDIRTQQNEILDSLRMAPTLFTHRGRGAGVLLHPRVYNDMVRVYQMAQDAGLIDQQYGEMQEWDDAVKQWGEPDVEQVSV